MPCTDYLKGTCTTPSCEKWHPPECLFYKSENGCRSGEKCSYAHRQVEEQPSKRSKNNGDKSAVALLKSTRQLSCVISGYGGAEVFIDFCGIAQTYGNQSDVLNSLKLYCAKPTVETKIHRFE